MLRKQQKKTPDEEKKQIIQKKRFFSNPAVYRLLTVRRSTWQLTMSAFKGVLLYSEAAADPARNEFGPDFSVIFFYFTFPCF